MEVDTARSMGFAPATSWQSDGSTEVLPEPVHFIGIGGIGMSALARLLLDRGVKVSGSDKVANPITDELVSLGAEFFEGHRAENVEHAGSLVVSTAITEENPELQRARQRGLPVLHRSEMLSYLSRSHEVIAVSGTHGKTTTTGMVAQVLLDCGLDPAVVVGGVFDRMGSNAHPGRGKHFVLEADESDRTHAQVRSRLAIITNIEPDHLENYPGGLDQILDVMASFANGSKMAVVCLDDPGCQQLLPRITSKIISYGTSEVSPNADWILDEKNGLPEVQYKGKTVCQLDLNVPGRHNRLNALAALAVAENLGVKPREAAAALSTFTGVDRRFQKIGTAGGVLVIDDYGHHPTEVRATLQAAQQYRKQHFKGDRGRIVALFQPHQPGRLRDLWQEFVESFGEADLVLIADVYVARGGQIEGINSKRFSEEITHKEVHYLPGKTADLAEQIVAYLQPDDIVLTIGAGDITTVGKPLLELLSKRG